MAQMEEMSKEGSQFTLSQQDQSAKGALLENAMDIKVRLAIENTAHENLSYCWYSISNCRNVGVCSEGLSRNVWSSLSSLIMTSHDLMLIL